MKRILTILLSFCISCVLSSQNAFIKYFGTTSTYQSGEQIASTADGHLIIAGIDQTTPFEQKNFFLTKLTTTGGIVWNKILHTSEPYVALNALAEAADGGFLIGGGRQATPFSYGEDEVVIVKTDADGDIQWSKSFGYGVIKDIAPLPDGGFVTSWGLVDAGITYFWIARLSATGDLIWQTDDSYSRIEELLVTPEEKIFFVNGGAASLLHPDGTILWDIYFATPGTYATANCAAQLNDGRFLIQHQANNGEFLTWMDVDGNILNQQQLSNSQQEFPSKILELSNGEIVILKPSTLTRYNEQGDFIEAINFGEAPLEDASNGLDLFLLPNDDLAVTGFYENSGGGSDPFIALLQPDLDVEWLKVTGDHLPGSGEFGYASVEAADGGIVVAGRRDFTNKMTDFYIVKTDAFGNKIWERNYGSNEYDLVNSIVRLSDGGFLLLGFRYNYPNDNRYLVMVKVDANGNLVWEKYFDYSGQPLSNDFLAEELPNGELAILFRLYGGAKAMYMRTDAQGNSLLVKTLDHGDVYYDSRLTSDGNLLLAGYEPDGSFAIVNKIDTDGNTIFSTSIEPGSADFGNGLGIEETSDGGALVLSNVRFSYRDTVMLSKLDINGNLEWSKLFNPSEAMNGDETFFPNLAKTSDGNYLISVLSFHENVVAGNLIYLIKVDEQGNEIWSKRLENEIYDEVIYDMKATADDGLLLTGYAYNFKSNDYDMLLIKTLPDGTVSTFQPQHIGQMSLSPNPSPGDLTIQFQSEVIGPLTVEIFQENNGQCLRRFITNKNALQWEGSYQLSDLPSGIYSLRITINGHAIAGSWVKT